MDTKQIDKIMEAVFGIDAEIGEKDGVYFIGGHDGEVDREKLHVLVGVVAEQCARIADDVAQAACDAGLAAAVIRAKFLDRR